ncbi:DUF3445 domain-containing protein [Pleurostoma richardsiae]|uniref:DUF3445 domain-containing protein n=1 Tax=Pleurostoma richardsiae TaxID=41990 RepID=A0AA38VQ62_9PEZI|nr:DUF3445 domain-containing protein [Pleurostoma richardsiae]
MALIAAWLFAGVVAVLLAWKYGVERRRSASKPRSSTPTLETARNEKAGGGCPAFNIEPMPEFKWEETDPLQFRPWKPTYYITMAIQNSSPSDLITMDSNYKDRVEYRRDIIAKHPKIVHGHVPAGVEHVQELYEYMLGDYLPKRFPTMFSVSADGKTFHNKVTGAEYPLPSMDDTDAMLAALGETVEDDIFTLRHTEQGHQSTAFVCVHCSGFDPSKKLGVLMSEIHEPVPGYEKIGASMERFFTRLEVGKSVKRVNWSIVTTPELYNCFGNHIHDGEAFEEDEDVDIDNTFMRIELQTLSRLPKTQAIVFSFKTYMYPIKQVKDEGLGLQLAEAIEGLKKGNAPKMWMYKGGVRWGKSVLEYLRS